jgi:hypothetical protein
LGYIAKITKSSHSRIRRSLTKTIVRGALPMQTYTMVADCFGIGRATIDKLTDDAFLEIFDFHMKGDLSRRRR